MKKEITIPVQVHEITETDRIAEADHRKNYSIKRDLLAADFNRAIVLRLDRDKEKLELSLREENKNIKCEKCGKEYSAETSKKGSAICPECMSAGKTDDLLD